MTDPERPDSVLDSIYTYLVEVFYLMGLVVVPHSVLTRLNLVKRIFE